MFIPLTVGGGVRQVEDVRRLLNAGADKVSINTAAVQNPELVREAAGIVGNQCIVVAIDAKKNGHRLGGLHPRRPQGHRASTRSTGRGAWREAGAGEILLTSMDRDGTRDGFDLGAHARGRRRGQRAGDRLRRRRLDASTSPRACSKARADAVLAASVFHFGDFTVRAGEGAHARARHRGAPVSLARRSALERRRPGRRRRAGRFERTAC